MGRFSNTVHIKADTDSAGFIDLFREIMKKRGFVPSVENEAALSYSLAFSEGGWTTLTCGNYRDDPKKTQDDLKYIAKELKTSAFSVEVVDSDFAILTLNSGDTVIVGDGSGYGIEEPSRGNRKYWESLLASGKTWEQFSEITQKDSPFVEEILSELAVVLGILPEHICAECSELSDSENAVQLYFKKAEAKEKAMTLNAAFKQVFGEALEPLGFKLIKSKYPYFVRLIGDEIIHVITCRKVNSNVLINYGKRFYAYEIVGGVATVYRAKIDLNKNPNALFWLFSNCDIYTKQHPYDCDLKYRREILEFRYNPEDYDQMKESFCLAFDATKDNLLPALVKSNNIEACINFFYKFHANIISVPRNYKDILNQASDANECLLFLLTNDYQDVISKEIDREISEVQYKIKMHIDDYYVPERFDECCENIRNFIGGNAARLGDIVNNNTLYEQVKKELQRRKKYNAEILKGYGLNFPHSK